MESTNGKPVEKDLPAEPETGSPLSEADLENIAGGSDPCEGGQLRRPH